MVYLTKNKHLIKDKPEGQTYLFAFSAAHEGGLGALEIDVGPKVFCKRLRGCLGLLNRGINLCLSLLIKLLLQVERSDGYSIGGQSGVWRRTHLQLLLGG